MRSSILRGCLAAATSLGLTLGLVVAAGGSAEAASRPVRVVDLGSLGGGETFARDVNQRGQVTGYGETADGTNHAFV